MNKFMISFVAAMSLTSFGCKKKGAGDEVVKKTEELTEKVCKCADLACATKATEEHAKWASEWASKNKDAAKGEPDAALAERMKTTMTKQSECMTKLTTAAAGSAAGSAMAGSAEAPKPEGSAAGSAEAPKPEGSAAPAAGSAEEPKKEEPAKEEPKKEGGH